MKVGVREMLAALLSQLHLEPPFAGSGFSMAAPMQMFAYNDWVCILARAGNFPAIQTRMFAAAGSEALAKLFGAAARVADSDSNLRGDTRYAGGVGEIGIVFAVAAGTGPGRFWCLCCMTAALKKIGTDPPKQAVVRWS